MIRISILLLLVLIGCQVPQNKESLQKQEQQIQSNQEKIVQLQAQNALLLQKLTRLENSLVESNQATTTVMRQLSEVQSSLAANKREAEKWRQEQEKLKKKIPVTVKELPQLPALSGTKKKPWNKEEKTFVQEMIEEIKEEKAPAVSSKPKWWGKQFPQVRFIDSSGSLLDIESFRGKKVLLVVLRGFAGSICLSCSSQTIALTESLKKFETKNTKIVLMYPGRVDSVSGFLQALGGLNFEGNQFQTPFPIVLDVDLQLVQSLEIEGDLAKPTSIIIDEKGLVRYVYVGGNIEDRPSVPSLLEAIDKISSGDYSFAKQNKPKTAKPRKSSGFYD